MLLSDRIDHTKKQIKAQSANIITLFNLCLGIFAILLILNDHSHMSLLMIFLACLFDRFDGSIARKLNVVSDFGKELDSLCDLISFGVAPALLLYQSILFHYSVLGIFATILYILCGAIRLARYNITDFDDSFQGLPITVAGCLLTLSYLAIHHIPSIIILIFTILLAYLMVSSFRIKKV
ncbi:MAG: CDP-diacylglycerol--serine O-phosphatidyltransferase [Tuberibacillus sp.]